MLGRSFLRMMPGDMSMMLDACFYEFHALRGNHAANALLCATQMESTVSLSTACNAAYCAM
jgi:hypothetical protein